MSTQLQKWVHSSCTSSGDGDYSGDGDCVGGGASGDGGCDGGVGGVGGSVVGVAGDDDDGGWMTMVVM